MFYKIALMSSWITLFTHQDHSGKPFALLKKCVTYAVLIVEIPLFSKFNFRCIVTQMSTVLQVSALVTVSLWTFCNEISVNPKAVKQHLRWNSTWSSLIIYLLIKKKREYAKEWKTTTKIINKWFIPTQKKINVNQSVLYSCACFKHNIFQQLSPSEHVLQM